MPTLYDLAYHAFLAIARPVIWSRPALRKKLARARRERNGDVPRRSGPGQCVLIHAVSVGEVNATREMVRQLLDAPEANRDTLQIVVSVTTDTGFERAGQLYGQEEFAGRVSVVRYPLDLSAYVRRFLDRLRPDVAVLMELEVWPNFVKECNRRGIPVLLVNGRMTERSYRGYRRVCPLVRPMYAGLSQVCAQEEAYAERFVELGVPRERVSVTGTMKFDSALVGERVEGDAELAQTLGLNPRALGGDETILVCGSTGPGEEAMLLDAWKQLARTHRALRLILVPRKPERFDEVAREVTETFGLPLIRRSAPARAVSRRGSGADESGAMSTPPVILGDTMGELRKFYSLADLVVVGRTLVDLGEKQHGSDMIEPAALGKPTVVGPFTGNFAEPMRAFLAAGAIRQVGPDGSGDIQAPLTAALEAWLADPAGAAEVGRRGRQVVVDNQGATARHVEAIRTALARRA